MSIELKPHLKLTQQLVMPPQLQQAIKLLQLSRMELVDLVREEMMENPVLEDAVDTAQEQSREREEAGTETESDHRLENAGETEQAAPDGTRVDKETEVKGDSQAVSEIDWDNYLENYTMAPPMPSYR